MITLTIICITFNDPTGFERTLKSIKGLLAEGGESIELVVVDGAESSETVATIAEQSVRASVIAEPDRGIYDAMNKGIQRARGRYIWFLNGGDESLVRWRSLRDRVQRSSGVLLGDYELVGKRGVIRRRSRAASAIWHGLPTSHQAILYPRNAIPEGGYSEEFQVVSDYELTARIFAAGVPFDVLGFAIARFYLDGLSTSRMASIAVEAARVQREVLHLSRRRRLVSRVRHRFSRFLRTVLAGGR